MTSRMLQLSLLLLITAPTILTSQWNEETRVLVRVYYESLCPDSVRFVRDQLVPTYKTLGLKYMKIDFIPFGKAKSERREGGGLQFKCQHGPRECYGNMMQACALSYFLDNPHKRMSFVACVMSSQDPADAGPTCADTVGLDYNNVMECLNSPAGEALLYHYEQRTLDLYPEGIPFVPTITINNKFDQDAQDEALRDLKSVVCAYIPESERPQQCL